MGSLFSFLKRAPGSINWGRRLPVALCVAPETALVAFVVLASTAGTLAARAQPPTSRDWRVWNGDSEGDHYSPLTQINRQNVSGLRVAWTFDTREPGGLETNPLGIR